MKHWIALILGMSIASTSVAYMEDYLPFSKEVLTTKVVLKSLPLDEKTAQLTPAIKITRPNEDEMVLSGVDDKGKTWSFTTRQSDMYEAYQADLDGNGKQDLVLIYPTMGTGLAPTTHILTLAFDKGGRPVVSEIEGYFENNEKGITDLVDTNKNGKAELLYMNYDGGYWITSLYELNNARWQKLEKSGDLNFPLYTRFTSKPNHKAVKPKGTPYSPDLTNLTPVLSGTLSALKWANIDVSEDIELTVKTAKGNKKCSPVSWSSSFMATLDTPNERKIVSMSAQQDTLKALLEDIKKQGYTLDLYGQRGPKKCSPELLWAQGN